jgi:molecular chaperone GrpE
MEVKQDIENESLQKETENNIEQPDNNSSTSQQDPLLDKESIEKDELKSKLKNCEEEILKNALEAQNMRNRYEAQIVEIKKYALSNIAKEIINIMDNLDMALKNEKEDPESLKQTIVGISLTKTQLENILTKFKIQKINPKVGDSFDYELHHAVSQVQNSSQKENTIIQVMQVGYKIEDRLLRAALVSVASEN